jgi:hypothetical protein
MEQSLWNRVWQFLKLKPQLPFDPAIYVVPDMWNNLHSQTLTFKKIEVYIPTKIFTLMFIALFVTALNCEPRHLTR